MTCYALPKNIPFISSGIFAFDIYIRNKQSKSLAACTVDGKGSPNQEGHG